VNKHVPSLASRSDSTTLSLSDSAIPSRWRRFCLAGLLLGFLAFGVVVEIRSAFLKRHMTDWGVFARAAWAVRAGEDPYAVTDDNGWHYHYPTLFAILLAPLADPPAGVNRSGYLPFAVTVAVWYLFSLGCLVAAVHLLASALEQVSPGLSSRWWALRVWPVLACLPPIGHTLARGQVNLLLLFLLCGMAAAVLRGRGFQAGFWLAGAICLKIIPAVLLIYPVWRRDRRCLAGGTLGLILGLGLIPTMVFGPAKTWAYFREWDQGLRQPALAGKGDQSRAKELIEVTATDSQSILAILHNTIHFDRATRPAYPDGWVRIAHWLIGGILTAITILVAGRRVQSGTRETVFFGAMLLMMLLLSPVCHLHYFCLLVPLAMGLLAALWERPTSSYVEISFWLLLGLNGIASMLPHFPGMEATRDLGLVTYVALVLWLASLALLWKHSRSQGSESAAHAEVAGVAA